MKKKSVIIILIITTIVAGFVRDYIFVSINEKTGQGTAGSGNLFYWKWILTFMFALLYLVLTCLFLYLFFRKKKYIRLTVFVYAGLFTVSLLTAGTGSFISSFEKVYPFIRTVMGIAQSPVVMMILISACLLNEANKK
ncbi:MAG: hypothetical protein AABZ32_12560 [Bacteroidota bacterium]